MISHPLLSSDVAYLFVCARFDNQGFSQTQAMDAFAQRFGNYNPTTKTWAVPTYFLSFLNGFPSIGQALGAYIGSIISARYGRRMTVFVMSIWAIVSAIIIITSKNKVQILMGRILNYVYVGMELSVISVFQAELMPGPIRGFAVGSYQMSIGLGGIVINIICNRTATLKTDAAFLIPFAMYFIVPTIVSSLVWFMPESPRWLLSKGRVDEAAASLGRIRVDNSPDTIESEIHMIQLALEMEKERGSYLDLFRKPNRRRTSIAWASNFFLQASGQSFVSQYGAVFFKSIGAANPFALTIGNTTLLTGACLINMCLMDHVGRRPMYLIGSMLQGSSQFIVGAMGTQQQTQTVKTVIVAFTMSFAFFYGIGIGPLNWVTTTEVPDQRLRDKTVRTAAWVNTVTTFVVSFTLPYLLNAPYANLSSKVGFIYGSITFTATVWAYFFLPELGGRTLDEIDLLFHDNISAIASSKWKPDTLHELEAIALGEHGDKGNREDVQKEDVQQIEQPSRV
ncbi:hypothetical protein JCM24511_07378 [Saitozyma sp. JCM 24511]|nr:hypothetical protein JCM24511_07378 [Saitozyma sp. JCM 24511]